MSPDAPAASPFWRRTEARLAGAGFAAVAAVYLGFLGVPVAAAEEFIKRGGYYVILGAFALFLWSLRGYWRTRAPGLEPLSRRQAWLAGAAIALFSLLAILSEPFRCKVLYDEFVLQSTAFNMHFFRDVATMVRGYDIEGVFLSTDNYLDKRPYFYPFLVSLVHDLTGYRPLNAHLLNAALMPAALTLAFAFARRLAGWVGGLVGVMLLGSLPLLGQNATGSGMELLNVVMLLAALVLAADFLRAPGEEGLAAFLLCTVLLAQSRYESALFAGPAGLVMLLGWWRERRVILSWTAAVTPLLFVPVALQNKVLSNNPMLWELGEASTRFSTEFLPKNLTGCATFLFNPTWNHANSLLLTLVGLAGLAWLCLRFAAMLRRGPAQALRAAPPAGLVLAAFALGILANLALEFCYYWSSFDDPMASRFALPLYLLLAFAAVLLARDLQRWVPANRALLLLTLLYTCGVSTTRFYTHLYSHLGIDEIEWTKRVVASRPAMPRLIITNRSTLPWLLLKTPSILIDRAKLVADRIDDQLHDANFGEILVLQTLPPANEDGDFQVLPAERMTGFRLETLAERRFGTKVARVSRLLEVEDSAVEAARKMGGHAPK